MNLRRNKRGFRESTINRRYQSPAVFGDTKKKSKPKISFKPYSIKWIVFVLIIIFGLYFVFYSNLFVIKDIIVEGNKTVSQDEIVNQIPKGSNIFLFNVKDERSKLLAIYPEFSDLEIYRGIPNALKIVVSERENKIIWQTNGVNYLVADDGTITKKVEGDEGKGLALIIDKNNISVEPGSKIVTESFISFVSNIVTNLELGTNIKPDHFEVTQTTFNINLYTQAGFYVKLSTRRSSQKQLNDLKSVLIEKKADIHEYIDLRVNGWAYYK